MRHTATLLRVFLVGFLLLLSTGMPGPVSTGINIWTTNGPEGEDINLLSREKTTKPSLKGKRVKAAWDKNYLLKILTG